MNKYKISEDDVFCDRCDVRLHEDTNWVNECRNIDGDEIWCDACGAQLEAEGELYSEMWQEEHEGEEE